MHIIPRIIEINTVWENPFLNLNDAATGIIIIDDTTRRPITFMDADIVKLSNTENNTL